MRFFREHTQKPNMVDTQFERYHPGRLGGRYERR